MDRNDLRHHLQVAARVRREESAADARPDHFSRVAARWLAAWRPEKLGVALPACTCSAGRCAICN